MKKTSYKDMIRNRISNMREIDLALKWCKAKERWIDHVYNCFINIYTKKEDRYEAVRIILGISKKDRKFNFHSNIHWDNLDNYDRIYWESIESWVNWFTENLNNVENDINSGATFEEIKQKYANEVEDSYLFTRYLINNL